MAFRQWFPRRLQTQALFHSNFTKIFVDIADSLGFTAVDVAKLEADNAVLNYLAQMEITLKAYKVGFQNLRDSLTRGKTAKTPGYPNFALPDEPPVVPNGIFDRLFALADRITVAANYTPALGGQLGILPRAPEMLRADDLTPRIKAKAIGEARAEVRFVRGKTSGINLYFRREGDPALYDLGKFFYSPLVVKIPLLDGRPERISISAKYLIGNDSTGNFSPSVEIIVAP